VYAPDPKGRILNNALFSAAADIDLDYKSITSEPCDEHENLSVIPRCAKVAQQLLPLIEDKIR
jgi:hypothetical protein